LECGVIRKRFFKKEILTNDGDVNEGFGLTKLSPYTGSKKRIGKRRLTREQTPLRSYPYLWKRTYREIGNGRLKKVTAIGVLPERRSQSQKGT